MGWVWARGRRDWLIGVCGGGGKGAGGGAGVLGCGRAVNRSGVHMGRRAARRAAGGQLRGRAAWWAERAVGRWGVASGRANMRASTIGRVAAHASGDCVCSGVCVCVQVVAVVVVAGMCVGGGWGVGWGGREGGGAGRGGRARGGQGRCRRPGRRKIGLYHSPPLSALRAWRRWASPKNKTFRTQNTAARPELHSS